MARAGSGLRIAIVAAEYNRRHVDGLLRAARGALREAGARTEVYRVPGGFEIPLVAESLAREGGSLCAAIICLGVIIRGETAHADLIAGAITRGLMQTMLWHGVPVIHEVLLVANRQQADARCLGRDFNRGREAAHTALAMARIMKAIRKGSPGGSPGRHLSG